MRAYVESRQKRGDGEVYTAIGAFFVSREAIVWPEDILVERFRCPVKVAYAAMMRACDNGLIEYGTSLRGGWLTPSGIEFLRAQAAAEKIGGTEARI
jgi:hypothetical protein